HHRVGTTGAAENREPVAAFVATPTCLTVQVDAAGSTDPDGTIASYAWQFGEGGATGSGVSASHTYATAGQHTITLTVTDNQGATNVTTRQVTVTAPPPPGTALGQDAFSRSVVNGWGTAQVGGAWTSTGVPGRFSVDGSRGRHTLAAGATADSSLTAGTATSTDLRVLVSADKVPTGTGAWVHVQGRRVSATDYYGARLRLQPDGTVQLHTTRANGTTVTGGTVTGLTFAAGDQLGVRVQVEGTAPTTVRARVWKVGTPEPTTWFAVTTDSTASLQVPGAVGLVSFLTSSATNGPVTVSFDDLVAGPVVVNQAPSASFSATPSDLSVGVDASGSTDPDGTISSYAWTFGDGGTATGPTATHAYTQAGTYPVTLTVTDDDGATATTSRSVTVTAPPPNQAPVSAFQATTSHLSVSVDGSGSTDADGTLTGFAWDFGDGTTASTATASHTYAVPGDYTVSLTVTDDDGATGTSTAVVTATAPPGPPPPFVQDAFARSVTNGWGASDVGGAWTSTGSAGRFSVDGTVGRHTLAAGATADSALNGVSSSSTEVRVVLSADKVPNGTGAWVHVQGRRISAVNYLGARIRLQPTGAVELHATSGNGTAQAGGGVVTGLSFGAGDQLNVRLQVFGTSATATTVRAKVWKVGTPEPDAWRVTVSDTTASLQAPGGVGVVSYLTAGATNGPVVIGFDDLSAGPVP
ncbi:MAG: domain containing protein, partial [Actinotalea sp.]|nr:domain containing protein [Actinotalea sp.]